MPFSHPKHAGLAIWARSLINRINKSAIAIENLYFLPENSMAEEAMEKYSKLKDQLDQFITKTCFNNWKAEIESMDSTNINSKLDNHILKRTTPESVQDLPPSISSNPLFTRSRKGGMLESNFDSELHKVIVEVTYWTKIQAEGFITVPHNVSRLLGRKEQLRLLKESVMNIVRDYNKIMHQINDAEKNLFSEHLLGLDSIIEPGIRRHNWGSHADGFVNGCKKECQKVFNQVMSFQTNNMEIYKQFERISSTTLTNIQKRLYLLDEFVRQQEDTLATRQEELVGAFEKIQALMLDTYQLFIYRGKNIQKEWMAHILKLDKHLERALKKSVNNTLIDLSKHINGDKQR
jgi:dynein heavy chain